MTQEDENRQLKRRLAERSASEQRLLSRCEHLEERLSEQSRERGRTEGLEERASAAERECRDSRLEASHLRAELEQSDSERRSLREKVDGSITLDGGRNFQADMILQCILSSRTWSISTSLCISMCL